MPNPAAPFGFRAVRRLDGQKFGPLSEYTIASGLAANIGRGSLVISTGTGRNITIAADGNRVRGVFVGVRYRATDGSHQFKPNWVSGTATFASENAVALVIDDPNVVFEARVSAAVELADINQFAGIVVGAPDVNGNATTSVNSADITGTLDSVKILGFGKSPSNDTASGQANKVVEVLLAQHELRDPIPAQ